MTQTEITELLRQRHLPPKWIFLTNVRTRTGYGAGIDAERYIDAFAMCPWKSGNFQRIAYEIKSHRGDWLAELENPLKRVQAFLLSHQFWFVLAPGILKDDQNWWGLSKKLMGAGLIRIKDDLSLEIIQHAIKRTPFPMPERFVASLLRSAVKISELTDPMTPR